MTTHHLARALVAMAWCLVAQPAAAQTTPPVHKTETNGFALSAGLGNQYPAIGVQAAYYVQVPHSLFRVTPYLSVGAGLCAFHGQQSACTSGAVAGMMGSWGHKHRVVLNASYGSVGVAAFWLHGQLSDAVSIEGIGLAVGYEYMAFSGFFYRADIGSAYAFLPPLLRNRSPIILTLTPVGLGFKF